MPLYILAMVLTTRRCSQVSPRSQSSQFFAVCRSPERPSFSFAVGWGLRTGWGGRNLVVERGSKSPGLVSVVLVWVGVAVGWNVDLTLNSFLRQSSWSVDGRKGRV